MKKILTGCADFQWFATAFGKSVFLLPYMTRVQEGAVQ